MPLYRRIIPPVYLLLTLLAMWALDRWLPVARLLSPPAAYAGSVPILAGLALAGTGAGAFRRAGTPVRPFEPSTVLVTGGLYRFTRNPMYLGMLLLVTGCWIVLGSLSPVVMIPVLFFILREWFVKHEETFLEEIFGNDFVEYRKRVRRWL